MATEVVKMIIGIGEPLIGRLMLFDSLRMNFKEVKIRRNPNCALCGDQPSVTELIDYDAFADVEMPSNGADSANGHEEENLEITPPALKNLLREAPSLTLLDVREPHEWEIARIDGAKLTPLSRFEEYIPELDPSADIYLYCYKGVRSMTALKRLREAGFKNLKSLSGGIDQWAREVDPEMPRY